MKVPESKRVIRLAALFLAVLFANAPARAWQLPVEAAAKLRYRSISFDGQFLRRDDARFRIASRGFEFRSGVMLRSRDPALHMVRWFDGTTSSGRLANGQVIVLWPSMFTQPLVREVRVAQTSELAGADISRVGPYLPAPSHPAIPGYRYVTSVSVVGTDDFLGLWQRTDGPAETLVVSFNPSGPLPYLRVGAVPLRLNSLIIAQPRHNVSWEVTLTSDASRRQPLYILHYQWMPAFYRPLDSRGAGAS
jgi:hypothetical protein